MSETGELTAQFQAPLKKYLGDKTAKVLESGLALRTVEDLIRHYPRRYAERGELTSLDGLLDGELVTLVGEISKVTNRQWKTRKGSMLEVIVSDGQSNVTMTFFNQAWREREIRIGRRALFAGKVSTYKGKRQLSHPDYQFLDASNSDSAESKAREYASALVPVYPATAKLPSWKIGQCIDTVLAVLGEVPDVIPVKVRKGLGFPSAASAIRGVHQPETRAEAAKAREALAFEEAFTLQVLLGKRRAQLRSLVSQPRALRGGGLLEEFDARLPFDLTKGQREVSAEIETDLCRSHPMHRLLQGEVGSGKTVVALRAMLAVIDAGGQCALLAPTEVLAQQHFRSISLMLGDLAMKNMLGGAAHSTKVVLLTGSMNTATRRSTLLDIASGEAGVVIGTHALLSENVSFAELGLVVVDEQHRFGVEQRDALRAKGEQPHLLVMTATPIPRTVAMTVFGDLDVSILAELPKGRSPITTHVVSQIEKPAFVERAWQRVVEEVGKGFQAYVVVPRIGDEGASSESSNEELAEPAEGEESENKRRPIALLEIAPQLMQGPLSVVRVGILHGRLASEEKDRVMSDFARGDLDVLIATTVIEVGVDVSNATTMIVLDAERFGVSQLHQLRGRVGRGSAPGLCILISDAEEGTPSRERLDAVAATLDGFELSRIDLEQRREGDVLGASQSGNRSHLRLLRVLRDESLIESARAAAISLLEEDPELSNESDLVAALSVLETEEHVSFMEKG